MRCEMDLVVENRFQSERIKNGLAGFFFAIVKLVRHSIALSSSLRITMKEWNWNTKLGKGKRRHKNVVQHLLP